MRPRRGDRFRSTRDVEVRGLVTFRNPSSGGFKAVLPRGEIVIVENDPPRDAKAVYTVPERYEALEQLLVPTEDRNSKTYGSYTLVIRFEQLTEAFELLGRSGAA